MTDSEQKTPVVRHRVAVAIVVTITLVAGVLALVWQPWAGLPEGAAFAIGDRAVSEDELDERVETLRALYGVEPPEDPAKLDAFRRDSAKSVAVSMLLDQLASEQRIAISEKQARDVLDRFIANRYADGGRQAFVKALGEAGTSEPQVLAEIRRQLAVGRLMDKTSGDVSISDAELRAEFDKRKNELGTPERRKLRNIVVKTKAEARALFDALRSGASFATLAAKHSIDGSTRKSGGKLGALSEGELQGPVATAAFAPSEGELYGPAKGSYGWNVGRVDAILPGQPAKFAEVADQFRETLRTERAFQRWRSWLGKQIRDADILYADKYRPADPDAPPSSDIAGAVGTSQAGTGPR
ncbi:MAG: parvulin peptidyl-prolyl isomerase [Actinophytocola sp.]|nr:parvulin peptidyl-prolyl isomerase [Actinophytocola sp.]